MVAREVAEVFPSSERPIGTSGTTGSKMAKAAVQKLQGGEFLRIAINDGGARYLIHLPTANFSEPAPQPQAPSRMEVPPAAEAPRRNSNVNVADDARAEQIVEACCESRQRSVPAPAATRDLWRGREG